ncbi:PPE domain-containing protein [Mycobacterium riyadhense]|uniref:PPE domain-containing protein n=1 Tax=Mycobacterium riyadhense TaxID=486698 RepID=UPI001956936E|nr:PE family protein [Mycobacterium riyadhense]
MADSVRVDTEVVRAAGRQAEAAGGAATPGSNQVQPSAADMVSVGASARFTAQVTLARKYTVMANALARHFGVKLDASAAVYDDQEVTSAETLGSGGTAGAVPAGRAVPAGQVVPADLVSGGAGAGLPAGEVPASPRDIARLIETGRGGTGKKTWQAAEASLRSEAKQLDDAADQLGQAIGTTGDGWQAKSADAATTQMRALQTWYQGHARYVLGLAEQAVTHVQNFSKALTDVPPYRHVVDAERELKAALQSNAHSGGAHRVAVVNAQVKVSKLYQASTTGFTGYTFAEAAPEPKMPVAPPGPPTPNVPPAVPPTAAGGGPGGPVQPQHWPKSAPLEPVQGAPGVGENLTSGPTWPPRAVDPPGPATPLTDAVQEAAGGVPSEVIPGIIGGVVGGLGGLLGGLAAAPQKALQGLQQAAGPMMSGLGQHPQGGQPQHGGDQSPQSPEPPAGDLASPGDLGAGGGGGDTEPASGGEGPLAPPTDVAAARAAAAPATAPAPAPAPAEAPAPAMGAMGPMMPPVRGTGEGSGPDNKQLYQERKLKLVAPANSEPVKNRREGRTKPADRKTQ